MRRVLPLFAVLSLAFAPVPPYKPKPSSEDLKAMQGEWNLTYGEMGMNGKGRKLSQKGPLEISGTRMLNYVMNHVTEIVLDPTKTPKWIDLKLSQPDERSIQGIYKLEGDTLTICWGHRLKGRPTNFDIPKAEWYQFLKYERKKP